MRLLEGGPALMSNKLKIGDRIIAVNHEPVVGMDIIEAVELIRGSEGVVVTLTILRPQNGDPKEQEKVEVDITRAEVVLKETRLEKARVVRRWHHRLFASLFLLSRFEHLLLR